MALKDLISDLSNFKYGMSSPDKVDAQIDEGVDFFPNDEATGFTPKTNLESLYNKAYHPYKGELVQEKTIAPKGGNVRYYANLNPVGGQAANQHRLSSFGDSSNRIPMKQTTPPRDNPNYKANNYPRNSRWDVSISNLTSLNIGGFDINTQPAGNTYNSPFQPLPPYNFLNSPISNYVSSFNGNPFSLTHGTKAEPIRGDTEYNNRTYFITNQPAGDSFGKKRKGAPGVHIPNAHSLLDSLSKLSHNTHHLNRIPSISSPDWTTGVILGKHIQPFHTSTFMQTPIAGYEAGGGELWSTKYPKTPSKTWGDGDGTMVDGNSSPWSVNFPQFQNPFLSVLANHKSRFVFWSWGSEVWHSGALNTQYVSETWNIDNGYTSLHIPNYVNRSGVRAEVDAPWPTMPPSIAENLTNFANLPLINGLYNSDSITHNFAEQTPTAGYSAPTVNEIGNADYVSPKNIGPFAFGDGIPSIDNILANKAGITGDNKISDEEKKSSRYGGGKGFPKVPAGLNSNNKSSYKRFRSVADPGKYNHPLVLRDIGQNWGLDPFPLSDNPLGEAMGGFVRGAPGITGLISRNIFDKFRIGKWMFNTSDGLAFVIKQFALQALNPTLESKIYNPLSTLGLVGIGKAANEIKDLFGAAIGNSTGGIDMDEVLNGLGGALASIAFPIGHAERHSGGLRYEDVNPLSSITSEKGIGKSIADSTSSLIGGMIIKGMNKTIRSIGELSRLQAIAQNFKFEIPPSAGGPVTVELPGGDFSNDENGAMRMTMINPNKYLFPVSSAPISIEKGVPSFLSGPDVAKSHADRISKVKGSPFNKDTHKSGDGLKSHFTLPYKQLVGTHLGENSNEEVYETHLMDTKYISEGTSNAREEYKVKKRKEGKGILNKTGNPGGFAGTPEIGGNDGKLGENLGVLKGNTTTDNVDRINILPVLHGETLPDLITANPDFIKFRFKDVVNNKYLVFRALLSGITDTVTPEFNPVRYIGRPDNLYTYKGVDREIAFTFNIYPKTKQELPVLMEKMNYLVGLCYPSYTENERMITPFIELTIGDMFVDAPGLLSTLAITVEDTTTWEIDEGLQFPHYISAGCTFTYIGKHIPVSTGKHYDLDWLRGDLRDGKPLGSYNKTTAVAPRRNKHDYINVAAGLATD